MHKTLIAAGMALAMVSGPALAKSFSDYDENGNSEISKDEFYGSISDAGTFADWDTSGDGLIDENELGEIGAEWDYDAWDANTDGYVDSGEFYDGYYTSYDSNEDGHWDDGEWDDAGEAGLFDM
ncbi:hypothetical protein [Pararhizobium haloflavum]|uniref:hypothetical protein n=1 Tax=Pararhizobium haloflavum TaxID=2037914 RepID=UPI0012FFEBE8|nr:hypothetical protein [Pararhizobium haloflavum]